MREIGRVILETLIVVVVGSGLALAANAMSKHGLDLRRDYFNLPLAPVTPPPGSQPGPVADNATDKTKKIIKDAGFTTVEYNDVAQVYSDPKYQSDAYIIVDARNEEHYKAGHILRAWRLDYVHPELSLDTVLPFIQSAEKVVLYCHGGHCDDSLLLAAYLRDQKGIDPAKLNVYVGGIDEWMKKGQPVEKGERMSGDIATGGAK